MSSWAEFERLMTEGSEEPETASSTPATGVMDEWDVFERLMEDETPESTPGESPEKKDIPFVPEATSSEQYAQQVRDRQVVNPITGAPPSWEIEEKEQRSGEGVSGFIGDVAAGGAGGVIRGAEMMSKAGQWFAPEGSDMEKAAQESAEYFKALRDENEDLFGESRASQKAREGSAWNPRGWFHGGMESLGMLATAAPAGLAGVAGQFWGGTAQEAYDEAVANERQGIGRKLTEEQKVAYANWRGFWEGGLEMVQVAIASKIPALAGKPIFAKILPKKVQENIVRGAVVRPGNPALNVAKDLAKVVSAEVPMEMTQEYLGMSTDYGFGQSDLNPNSAEGWRQISGVIGPTIVMSTLLGAAGSVNAGMQRKQLHDALTKEDVNPIKRIAAVKAVHDAVAKEDPELAQMWLEQTKENLTAGKPVALPLDEEVRAQAEVVPEATGSDKLKTALEVEKANLEAQVQAKEEGAAERQAEGQATPEVNSEVNPEQANTEGVIGPELNEAPRTIEVLDQTINDLERNIESNPEHPHIEQFRRGLEKAKAERRQLLDEEKAAAGPVGVPETDQDVEASGQGVEASGQEQAENVAPEAAQKPETAKTDTGSADLADLDAETTPDAPLVNTKGLVAETQRLLGEGKSREQVLNTLAANWKNYAGKGKRKGADVVPALEQALTRIEEQNKLEQPGETKYSARQPDSLHVPLESIPDTLEVRTVVTSAQTGQTAETVMNAKKAVAAADSLMTKLESILECVRS